MTTKINETNFGAWNKFLSKLSPAYRELFENEKKFLISQVKPNSKILEVGCGNGRSLESLQNKGNIIYGLDYNEEAVAIARQRLEKKSENSIIKSDARDIPFKDDFFDYKKNTGFMLPFIG